MSSFWSRVARGSVIVVALGMATACASRAETEGVASAQGAALADESSEASHMNLIREALSKVTLRADQKTTIDQIAADAKARHAPIQQARLALASALADQVQAGTVDRTALQPKIDALMQAIQQERPAGIAALVRLHDLLDGTQRNQFVDALESQAHGEHHHPREGRGMEMRKWAADLNLTDAQRQQIHEAMKASFEAHDGGRGGGKEHWGEAHEGARKLFESFRQDQFAPDPNGPSLAGDMAEHRVDHIAAFVQTVVPILTPEQRAIAAQKIRSMHAGQ
jgi:hypothetical protein